MKSVTYGQCDGFVWSSTGGFAIFDGKNVLVCYVASDKLNSNIVVFKGNTK